MMTTTNCQVDVSSRSLGLEECEVCSVSKPLKGSRIKFLKAVSVWIKKPHVANRRLCGSKLVAVQRCTTQTQAYQYLKDIKSSFDSSIQDINITVNTFPQTTNEPPAFEDLSCESHPFTIITRQLIPKSEFFPRVYEAVLFENKYHRVTFIPFNDLHSTGCLPTNEISYCLQYRPSGDIGPEAEGGSDVMLCWSCDHQDPEVAKRQLLSRWLRSVLMDKLVNWSSVQDISTSISSLQLVDVDLYQKTYLRLKNQYGKDLVKNWTESTDPHKFVYEDIAIAAYLMLIWQEDRRVKKLDHKQTFVDLGCGNGLLVYILTKEGHKGLGIDLRKRKIWDTFGPDIDLQVIRTIK